MELHDWPSGGYVGAEAPPRDYVYDLGLVVFAVLLSLVVEQVRR